jgi:hypothetical protein
MRAFDLHFFPGRDGDWRCRVEIVPGKANVTLDTGETDLLQAMKWATPRVTELVRGANEPTPEAA